MNTEDELKLPVGQALLGIGVVQEKQLMMFFFANCAVAVRYESGGLLWEVTPDTEH